MSRVEYTASTYDISTGTLQTESLSDLERILVTLSDMNDGIERLIEAVQEITN